MKLEEKIYEFKQVLQFTLATLGVIIIASYISGLLNGRSEINFVFLNQIFSYLTIMMLGIIICYTSIVFKKVSVINRIITFSLIVFIFSLFYFKYTQINPLQSILMFTIYSFMYTFTVTIICLIWSQYQQAVSKKYDYYLSKYNK